MDMNKMAKRKANNPVTIKMAGCLVLAALAWSSGAHAAGLPALPTSLGQVGTALSGAVSAPAGAATLRIAPASLALPAVAAPDSLAAATVSGEPLPGLDGLSGGRTQALAARTNTIRPIRVPGGGSISIPLPVPLPLPIPIIGTASGS